MLLSNVLDTNGEGVPRWGHIGTLSTKHQVLDCVINCFCPNYLLLLPEFPIAFARISHCFCPNFPLLLPEFFVFKNVGGGGGAQYPPPLPPRLLRLWASVSIIQAVT